MCGKITILFLLVVRSNVCSAYLYREVGSNAGDLVCHHKYLGTLPYGGLLASITAVEHVYP